MLGNWHKLARMLPIMAPRMGTRSLPIVAMHTMQPMPILRAILLSGPSQPMLMCASWCGNARCVRDCRPNTDGATVLLAVCACDAHRQGGVHTHAHHRRVALGYWECATGTARLQAARAQWGACRCTQMNRWCVLKVRASNSGCGEQIRLRRCNCCWPLPLPPALPPVPQDSGQGKRSALVETGSRRLSAASSLCGLRLSSPVGSPAVLGIGQLNHCSATVAAERPRGWAP
jgi:hypothetical protein